MQMLVSVPAMSIGVNHPFVGASHEFSPCCRSVMVLVMGDFPMDSAIYLGAKTI
jgi:hypothetical protein